MPSPPVGRREVLARLALGAAGATLGCALGESLVFPPAGNGRISARPRSDVGEATPGLSSLLLQPGRDGVVYVPPGLPSGSIPLVVLLHGAGGSASPLEESMQPIADDTGCALLVPDSRARTWDIVSGGYGDDVTFINDALSLVFSKMLIDPDRLAVAGFSDGASYALGLGRINGDLFRRVIAFSPGFLPLGPPTGKPPFYITHGTFDNVLPLEATSRVIVENLVADGYQVDFHEWAGGHAIPGSLARDAFSLVSVASTGG